MSINAADYQVNLLIRDVLLSWVNLLPISRHHVCERLLNQLIYCKQSERWRLKWVCCKGSLCLEFKYVQVKNLLQVFVEARSSLYLCTHSSRQRDFTRLMWDNRWILGRESDSQIRGRAHSNTTTGWMSSTAAVWTQINTVVYSLLKLVDLFIVIRQLCGENKKR